MKKNYLIMFSCIIAIATLFNILQSDRDYSPLFNFSLKIDNSIGVNAHLAFANSVNYTSELCKSLKQNGVSFIRLDVSWWYGNYQMQLAEIDKAVYMADKYDLSILLNFPLVPTRTDNKTLKEWSDMLAFYAKRYDGTHEIKPTGVRKGRKVKIDYFEIMNEPDIACPREGVSVDDLFNMTKLSSETIRECRSDAVLVLPGLCYANDFSKKYLAYKDTEGNTLKDYVDVLNIHTYFDSQNAYIKQLQEWASIFKTSGLNSLPLWISEYGHSSWEYKEEDRANMYIQQTLIGLALGVEKMFYYQFHSYGGNYFSNHPQREEYFGLIGPSISNSYASFLENDGTFENALSKGDGLKRVYIRDKNKDSLSIYTLNKSICSKLKKSGITISGKGFTLNTISILHKDSKEDIVWEGTALFSSGNPLFYLAVSQSGFQDIEESDKLVFRISNVENTSDKWIGTQSYPVYKSLSTLTSLLPKITERPKMTVSDGYTKITWISTKNDIVTAVWSTDSKEHSFSCEKYVNLYDKIGNKRATQRAIFQAPVFIVGKEQIIIK